MLPCNAQRSIKVEESTTEQIKTAKKIVIGKNETYKVVRTLKFCHNKLQVFKDIGYDVISTQEHENIDLRKTSHRKSNIFSRENIGNGFNSDVSMC